MLKMKYVFAKFANIELKYLQILLMVKFVFANIELKYFANTDNCLNLVLNLSSM